MADRSCTTLWGTPKKRHASKTRAKNHMWSLIKRGAATKDELSIYECKCGFWHVGHVTKEKKGL